MVLPTRLQQATTEKTASTQQLHRLKEWTDNRLNGANQFEIQGRLNLLEKAFESYQKSQSTVEQLNPEALEQNDRAAIEDLYFEASCLMKFRLDLMKTEELAQRPSVENSLGPNLSAQVKLPKITPPKFDGDYSNWLTFYSKFKTLVHDKPYDVVYKFETLRNCLVGSAGDQLRDLELTEANYDEAIRLVYNRWNNPKLITHAHLKKLFEAPILASPTSDDINSLVNTVQSNLRALRTLGRPVDEWDDIVVYILLSKLDSETTNKWNDVTSVNQLPKLSELLEFLEKRSQALRSNPRLISNTKVTPNPMPNTSKSTTFNRVNQNRKPELCLTASTTENVSLRCLNCKLYGHKLIECRKFLKKSVKERRIIVRKSHVCFNCLESDHLANDCKQPKCKRCDQSHNEVLHFEVVSTEEPAAHAHVTQKRMMKSYCLLSTAIVEVKDKYGNWVKARAFIDSGSQWNFITQELAQSLGHKKIKTRCLVGTLGGGMENSDQMMKIHLKSSIGDYEKNIETVVLKSITDNIPDHLIDTSKWRIPSNITLADPDFTKPSKIDLLLGKSIEVEIRYPEKMKLSPEGPYLENSKLGWLAGGDIVEQKTCPAVKRYANCASKLYDSAMNSEEFDLKKFWELEEVEVNGSVMSKEETQCELKFKETVIQRNDGYYQVNLPFRKNSSELGESKASATNRLINLLKRLKRRPELYTMYAEFLEEYENLGHMKEIVGNELKLVKCYIPHQFVLRPSSSTTKLRVVFDASAKTSSGLSLNDTLMVGPTVQSDLFSILCRFRTYKVVFSADVEKMYRQIRVADEDCYFQCIIWKPPLQDEFKTFKLLTVTYGTSCAPYLATRTLNQIAIDQQEQYPLAAIVIQRDTYVDDILSGAESLEAAIEKRNQLFKICRSCNMNLRKWSSNCDELLNDIPVSHRESIVKIGDKTLVKTLGMAYDPKADSFTFQVEIDLSQSISKRSITSNIARIYDPLGLLSPIIAMVKIILQKLWLLKLNWDETPPKDLCKTWDEIRKELPLINEIKIPRFIMMSETVKDVELHGFSDASEAAYGACVYLRFISLSGNIMNKLICAKSRVAPLKVISVPRLELCAYELLCRLVRRLTKDLNLPIQVTYLWTDSTIVLTWVRSQSSQFKTFVANRVSKIHQLTDSNLYVWRHVPSTENPADMLSRGVSPKSLLAQKHKWFNGPEFLNFDKVDWPNMPKDLETNQVPEMRNKKMTFHASQREDLTERISEKYRHSFNIICRIFLHVNRFITNCKSKIQKDQHEINTNSQIDEAERIVIRTVQQIYFMKEYNKLLINLPIPTTSKLLSLSPFIDENGIMRVGGRLQNSNLSRDARNQILLPTKHFITRAVFRSYHFRCLHCGPQGLLNAVRDRFWVINGRNIARKVTWNCVICFTMKPRSLEPLMGQLPGSRLHPGHPFDNVCMDYICGLVIHQRGRGSRTYKVYVCVFVCMKTKAIHLEIVHDLSTQAFLSALKRMISRRGIPHKLYCDNGTNFVGARNELLALEKLCSASNYQKDVQDYCAENRIIVKFSPPRGPHFNGLAEAGVKSFKHHFYRIAGQAHMIYEEMNTFVIQIEAILNSRPLTELSSDPNDFEPLTPAHFLIGRPFTSFPEPTEEWKGSHLRQYHRLRQLIQHFWSRWSMEYINSLQHRRKWNVSSSNLLVGQLVIIKQDDVPPLYWPMGRITAVTPGKDGVVRIVTVKTANGVYDRPTVKVCPLPIENC